MTSPFHQYREKPRLTLWPLAAVVLAGACGKSDQAGGDSAAAATDSTAAGQVSATPAPDTSMAGMQHGATSEPAPRDSNQAFLRMMVDHHQGLVAMSDTAMPRLAGATAKSDAQTLREKQAAEQQHMSQMLQTTYTDSHAPMILPSNQAMIDSVRATTAGADADRGYYRQVIAHHQEGVHHVDMHLPHLTGEVKQMAEKMKADQQREIRELERKAGGRS
jgi:uncharacterized protein (DUF305 family)